jgi:hypothetical protein
MVNIAQGDLGILSRITYMRGNSIVTWTTAKILAWEFNWDDNVAEWRNGGMAEWQNGGMAEWRNGGMAEWLAKWRDGRNGYLPTSFMVHANNTGTF